MSNDTERTWTIGDLLAAADDVLNTLGPGTCSVQGTLSGWRMGRGFAGAELLEHSPDGRRQVARIPIAVPWAVAKDSRRALALHGIALEDGIVVTLHGRLEVHPHYGPLRFLVDAIADTGMESTARLAHHELIAQLEDEGLLHANASRPMPDPIERVGLVAPATGGAGRADFVGRLSATGIPFQIVEQPAAMQGPDAPAEIARAIGRLSGAGVDIIVVTRGGGAGSELAGFDSEPVARAIALAPVPVIVAVGHSTDRTLADDVAHTTLTTPTAAAVWLLDRHRPAPIIGADPNDQQLEEFARATRAETLARHTAERRLRAARRQALAAIAVAVVLLLQILLR